MSTQILILKDGILTEAVYNESGGYTPDSEAVKLTAESTVEQELILVDKDIYGSNDTNISLEEVYNKISLTCEIEEMEDLIKSPLDDSTMYSPYNNKQHYCTEMISQDWPGKTSIAAFRSMVLGNMYEGDFDKAHWIDWYIRTYKSSEWEFNADSYIRDDQMYQCDLLKYMNTKPGLAAIVETGQVEKNQKKDNAVEGQISMSKYLVISVNGNGEHENGLNYPQDDDLTPQQPCAKYIGNMSGGLFSPIDSLTTNYLLISGDIVLNARPQLTGTWPTLWRENGFLYTWNKYWLKGWIDPPLTPDEPAYYTMKFYDNVYPHGSDIPRYSDDLSIRPYNNSYSSKIYQYNYSENGDSTDRILKLPLVACRLKIGDKYCVEQFNEDGSSTYKWLTESELPVVYDDGQAVTVDYFTIGPNPKIEDYIIGQEYPLANNVTPDMNIEEEGIAIPIKFSDKLTGEVSFEILGPINCTWDQITKKTKRKWIFWKSTKWYSDIKYLLASTGAIWLKDFEITLHSDNGNISRDDLDNDLIYQSDENTENYINQKDDIEFNISTALTSAECLEKGLKQTLKLNNPIISSSKTALRSIYNTVNGNQGKAEEHYITNYWTEYRTPKLLINSTFKDNDYSWTTLFKFNQFPDDQFYIQSYVMDVKNCNVEYTLKQR